MFENKGMWYANDPKRGKKAFATKEEAEAYENGTEKLNKLQEDSRANWYGEAEHGGEEEEKVDEKETSSDE